METILEKNIAALQTQNAKLAEMLKKIDSLQRYEAVKVGENPIDIDIFDHEKKRFLYDRSPRQGIARMLLHVQQEDPNKEFLYLMGLGTGFFVQSLLLNHPAKTIFLLEPEIEILWMVFHWIDFSSFLVSRHLMVATKDSFDFSMAAAWMSSYHYEPFYFHRSMDLLVQPGYRDDHLLIEWFDALMQQAIRYIAHIRNAAYEDTLKGVRQTLSNSDILCRSKPLQTLSESSFPEYAVIVSTGPSLGKQLKLLKQIQPYATIISVDASFPILEKAGIQPHFVVSMERDEPTARFFKETSAEFHKKVRFVLSVLQHRSVFENIHTQEIYLAFRPSFSYFALREFGILGYGTSAANMALELAIKYLHHKKIVFIGQDLAYGENFQTHDAGHIITRQPALQEAMDRGEIFEIEAYGGKGTVKTNIYWKGFKDGLEEVMIPLTGSHLFINATEGGARIAGTREIPFAKVCRTIRKNGKKFKIRQKKIITPITDCRYRFEKKVSALVKLVKHRREEIDAIRRKGEKSIAEEAMMLLEYFGKIRRGETSDLPEYFLKSAIFSSREINRIVYRMYEYLTFPDRKSLVKEKEVQKTILDFFDLYDDHLRRLEESLIFPDSH